MSEPKKIMGGLEKLVLLAAILIIGYIGLRGGGVSMVERTESVKIIDKPHAGWKKDNKRTYSKSKKEKEVRVEAMLAEFAAQFSDGEVSAKGDAWSNIDMSREELQYYQNAPQWNPAPDSEAQQTSEWFSKLKTSYEIYSTLKSILSRATGKTADEITSDDLDHLLRNKSDATQVFSEIQQYFEISQQDIEYFAQSGKKAISDWAVFIERHSK